MTDQAAVRSSEEEPAEDGKAAERGNRDRGKRRNRGQGNPAARGTAGPLDLEELRKLVELIDSHGFTDFEIERADHSGCTCAGAGRETGRGGPARAAGRARK